MISLNEYLAIRLVDLCKSLTISFVVYKHKREAKKKDISFKMIQALLKAMDTKPSEFFDDKFLSDDVSID